ncbi:MAG: hypothetical protein OWT28_04465 [Firmicutes bacterium]|nr:hypothetical protein [Bacillota bacterium]
MGNFWPTLPIRIPASPGMPILWDIVWWLFQLVVMVTLLILFRTFALRIDRIRNEAPETIPPVAQSDDHITPSM